MGQTTLTVRGLETPIAEIVASPRAAKALRDAGFATLADVKTKGVGAAAQVALVGEVTVQALIEALGPQMEQAPEPTAIEEGPHPLHLHSPPGGCTAFPLKKAKRVYNPTTGTSEEQETLWLEFENGEAKLTSRMWFLRVHDGDEAKADADVKAGTPWRQQAAAWLRARRNFGKPANGFWLKSD